MIKDQSFEEIAVCLFDGDYDLGVAAFANSLVKSNFKGLVYIGCRGILPVWVNQLKALGETSYSLSENIVIRFKEVDTEMHLGYYKPYFIKETFNNYKDTNKVFYFDADITINSPWTLFSNWLEKGACLCLDNAFHFLYHSHPWRKDWRRLAAVDKGMWNDTNYYFNSGFIGIERESIVLLDRWIDFTEKYIEMGGNISLFAKESYSSFKGDQDLLNAAVTISPDIAISIMGKEAMGFTLPATIMTHAIGDIKPWNKGFTRHLIRFGRKPNFGEKTFFLFCKYPICIFTKSEYKLKKLDLLIASFFGRFFG
jgi:lipopolysaccharide biosynthesis glycosyltransferase